MKFLSWIKKIFKKGISTTEADDKNLVTLVKSGQKIKFGTPLEVKPNFVAVLCYHNKVADVFEEGKYRLETDKMPMLTRMQKLTRTNKKGDLPKYFKADIYYVNLNNFENIKFFAPDPIIIKAREYKSFEARLVGTFSYHVKSPVDFLESLFTQYGLVDDELAKKEVENWVAELSTKCIQKNKPKPQMLFERDSKCFEGLADYVDKGLYDCGISVFKIEIDDVKFPKKVYKHTPFVFIEEVDNNSQNTQVEIKDKQYDNNENLLELDKTKELLQFKNNEQSRIESNQTNIQNNIEMNNETNQNDISKFIDNYIDERFEKNTENEKNLMISNKTTEEFHNDASSDEKLTKLIDELKSNQNQSLAHNEGISFDDEIGTIRYKQCPTCKANCSAESLMCFNCGHIFKN